MSYLVGGSGNPLVLVHGIGLSSFTWRLNWEALGEHARLFVPDLLSISSKAKLDCSLEGYAARLKEFLDATNIDQTDIVASSHGGAVALALAATARERLRSLVLVSPANPFARRYHRMVQFYLGTLGGIFLRCAPFLPGPFWDYGIARMYADRARLVRGRGIGYARPLRKRGATRRVLSTLRSFINDLDRLRDKLPVVAQIPTLLVWGDRDPVVEIESAEPLRQVLHAKLAIIPNTGHLPYEEAPEEFNRIILDFLAQ
ncbi:MAG TPA: alpha/beta hydrolase [Terriglobales bacterium]|nr:alpha/beta hydrolase [Terriglobales bacterium]